MAEYEEVTGVVEVPRNVGVKGFLKAIEDILKLPRVQAINVDARGKVEYRHYVREGDAPKPLEIDFETLQPMSVIRNSRVVELGDPDLNGAVAVGQLFSMAAVDHLFPVAMVAGANTKFWSWYEASTTIELPSREELYGVPFLTDRLIEDQVLVLCAAYTRSAALIDTQKSYKLVIPQGPQV
jgi:hypothetical protein